LQTEKSREILATKNQNKTTTWCVRLDHECYDYVLKFSCFPLPNAPKLNSQLSQDGKRMLPSGAETTGCRTQDADEQDDDEHDDEQTSYPSDAASESFSGERARGTGIGDV